MLLTVMMHALVAVALVLAALVAAQEERALVLLDDASIEETHSAFFSYLQDCLSSVSMCRHCMLSILVLALVFRMQFLE